MWQIIFDSNCTLCNQLGLFSKKIQDKLDFVSQDVFLERHPQWRSEFDGSKLAAFNLDTQEIIYDEEAWSLVCEAVPALSQLNWLANRMGIKGEYVSHVRRSAEFLRSFCSSCGVKRSLR